MNMKKSIILDIVCYLFIALFCYAAASKLATYELFKAQIGKSPLITHYVKWISWMVPVSEFILSAGLLIPKTRLLALYGSFTIMTMFTLYIAFILTFSPYVPCSCGGVLNNLGWTEHMIFNIAFMCLAIVGIYLDNKVREAETFFSSLAA